MPLACSYILFIMLIMNGWLGPYISTIHALVILWAATSGTRVLKRWAVYSRPSSKVAPTIV